MTAALAFRIDEVEANASLVEGATKECFDCDPDNPRGVDPSKCTTCKGTRRQALAISDIIRELAAARDEADDQAAPKSRPVDEDADDGEGDGFDDDLLLEY